MALVTSVSKVAGLQQVRRLFPCVDPLLGLRKSSLWNPDYLDLAKSKYPEYEVTNIQIKGFDFPILEKYQKKIYWLARKLNLSVTDSWPQELQKLKVVAFKKNSEIPEHDYILKLYERNVQVSDVYCYQMPLFLDLVTTMCPPGVKVHVHPHKLEHYENRFVPEYKILELEEKLEELNAK